MDQPDLPSSIEWPDPTVDWWHALPSTPGADTWSSSDWQYLMTTALVHAQVWGNGDMSLLGELRNREERYGITPGARKQYAISTPAVQERRSTPLDSIAARRKLRVVNGGKSA